MIPWLWLIPAVAIGASIGSFVMGWLVSGKIADLQRELLDLQMSWNALAELMPVLDTTTLLGWDELLEGEE